MKKLVILLAATVLSVAAFSQSDTISFAANDWSLPEGSTNSAKDTADYSNGTYTLTIGATNGYYYNASSKYLLLGKQGAFVTLPAFSYAVERVDVVGTSGASAKVKQNIFVAQTAVSTETTGAKNAVNEYVIDAAHRTIGTRYTLQILSDDNTQISKIIVHAVGQAPKNLLDSIVVTNPKTDFFQNMKFAFDGIVTAYYSNGSKINVTDLTQFSGYDLSKLGAQTVTASFTDTVLAITQKATYTIMVNERPQLPIEATTYTSNVTFNEEDGVKATAIQVSISEELYPAMKVGTTSDQGQYTLTIPASTKVLHFHIAGAPSNTNALVKISSDKNDSITTVAPIADPGFVGSSKTLYLSGDPAMEHYFHVETNGATTLTFAATKKSNCRFILYGVNASELGMALPNVRAKSQANKRLINGQIVIVREGKAYNVLGF